MPQTRDCDFCGDDIPPGTGTMFVRTDGTAIHYCSAKCEKNADLGREPRDLEWIQDEEAAQLRRAEEGEAVAEEEAEDEAEAEEAADEAADEAANAEDEAADEAAEDADEEEAADAAEDEDAEA